MTTVYCSFVSHFLRLFGCWCCCYWDMLFFFLFFLLFPIRLLDICFCFCYSNTPNQNKITVATVCSVGSWHRTISFGKFSLSLRRKAACTESVIPIKSNISTVIYIYIWIYIFRNILDKMNGWECVISEHCRINITGLVFIRKLWLWIVTEN